MHSISAYMSKAVRYAALLHFHCTNPQSMSTSKVHGWAGPLIMNCCSKTNVQCSTVCIALHFPTVTDLIILTSVPSPSYLLLCGASYRCKPA